MLPCWSTICTQAGIPDEIIGGEIVFFGTFADPKLVDGGGLVIDVRSKATGELNRFVFGFNETGMWHEVMPKTLADVSK